MFHDVSQCFKSVSCFTSGPPPFTMFHDILRYLESLNDSHRRIGDRAAADRLRDHDNAAAMTPQGLSISPRK